VTPQTELRVRVRRLAQVARRRVKLVYLAIRRTLSRTLIERRRGIETAREVSLGELGLDAPQRVRYEPSGWRDLARVLRTQEVSDEDVFIDLGSGKGRVVLQAASYPFRRVIGVELSEELNAIARANIDALRSTLRCGSVEVQTADIAEYDVPDDVTVAYLYNAFRGDLFDAAVRGLLASLDRRERPLRLIYKTPLEEGRLLATGRAVPVRVVRGWRPGREWSAKMSIRMYLLLPRPACPAVG
jgi:hypothetical protein